MRLVALRKLVVTWGPQVSLALIDTEILPGHGEFTQIMTCLPPTIEDVVLILGRGRVLFRPDDFVRHIGNAYIVTNIFC